MDYVLDSPLTTKIHFLLKGIRLWRIQGGATGDYSHGDCTCRYLVTKQAIGSYYVASEPSDCIYTVFTLPPSPS